jgi:heme a synthase
MAVAALAENAPPAGGSNTRSLKAVRIWLYILAALVVAMIAVGGATRLTGSGLSITEWGDPSDHRAGLVGRVREIPADLAI